MTESDLELQTIYVQVSVGSNAIPGARVPISNTYIKIIIVIVIDNVTATVIGLTVIGCNCNCNC